MKTFGWGRYKTGVYPSGSAAAAGAAVAALRNRNIAAPTTLAAPFTPSGGSLIAAILFTPRVSGVLQVSGNFLIQNGANGDTYAVAMEVDPGTGLTVTGGSDTSDGWVMGSTVPPVVGGAVGSPILAIEDLVTLATSQSGTLTVFGISTPPQPIGVPLVVTVILGETGGSHALDQIAITNLSVMELP